MDDKKEKDKKDKQNVSKEEEKQSPEQLDDEQLNVSGGALVIATTCTKCHNDPCTCFGLG